MIKNGLTVFSHLLTTMIAGFVQTNDHITFKVNSLQNGQDSLDLLRDINRGLNDSLGLIRTISSNTDPGLYKD
ncbi:MAG: hypothetical protein IPM97_12425 [Bdellovibrionaceae bacterium]|nr:hypothetical protein [Pseudobdellovibrionaceae bacterium]